MATLSASRRNSSTNPTSNTPRVSISGNSISRMSSLNEEDTCNNSATNQPLSPANELQEDVNVVNNISDLCDTSTNNDNNESNFNKKIRNRACSERSDSGISDCSIHHNSNNNCTPLLNKKLTITEEPEIKSNVLKNKTNKSILSDNKYLANLNKHKTDRLKDLHNNYSSFTRRGKVKERIELFKCNDNENVGSKELKKINTDLKNGTFKTEIKSPIKTTESDNIEERNESYVSPISQLTKECCKATNKLNNKNVDLETTKGKLLSSICCHSEFKFVCRLEKEFVC